MLLVRARAQQQLNAAAPSTCMMVPDSALQCLCMTSSRSEWPVAVCKASLRLSNTACLAPDVSRFAKLIDIAVRDACLMHCT